MNKGEKALKTCKNFIEMGGRIDFTTSSSKKKDKEDPSKPSKALKLLLEDGVNIDNISFSSDGQGSLPQFDDKGNYLGLTVADVATLFEEVKDCVIQEDIPLEEALKVITINPANFLKLENKGQINENFDADIVFLDKSTLEIKKVMVKGRTI
jgi:beta-aspartyl-dipeptidase (metallo-type)